ncbi:MAG: histidine kinase [Saprospiraceae bacterium]
MKIYLFPIFLLFCSSPLLLGQSIATTLKAKGPLQLEWVQQRHLLKGGSQPGQYPLYPDQLENGEWEIRIGINLYQDTKDGIKGTIGYISYLHFPERKMSTSTPTPRKQQPEMVRSTRPIIVDTRFEPEYFNAHLFHFNQLLQLPFDVDCESPSITKLLASYQDQLDQALIDHALDEQQKEQLSHISLPATFTEESWQHFICALLASPLSPGEGFQQLPDESKKAQLVANYFRIDYPAKRTLIQGQINNPSSPEVRIQFFNQENWLAFWKDTIIRLDPAGSFKLAFPFDYAQEVSLSHGYKTMRCYLEPGDSLSFRTDANAFYQKMTFTGTATGPQQFLLDYFHEMRGDTFFHSYDHQLLEQDQLDFLAKTLKKEQQELQFLKDRQSTLDPAFIAYMDRSIRFHYASILWEAAARFYADKDLVLAPAFAHHAEQLRSLLYRLPPQRIFDFNVDNYLGFQFARLNGLYVKTFATAKEKSHLSKLLLPEETMVHFQRMNLFRMYAENQRLPNSGEQLLKQLLAICKDPNWKKELLVFSQAGEEMQEPFFYRTLPAGQAAPNWRFLNKEGLSVELKDFSGKKVLLHIGWLQNLESAINDVIFFKTDQTLLPEIIHLIQAENKESFEDAINGREGLFIYVTAAEMQVLQDSYRVDNTSNHYFLIDEKGRIIANHFDLGTPTQLRGAWAKVETTAATAKWSPAERLSFWRGIGIGAIALFFLSLVYLWQRQVAAKRALRQRQLLELELKGIRAQMNPHFLFNAMSSIQNLIRKQEQEKADVYLSQFAGLMRRTLRNTAEEYIPLSEEIAMIEQYCSLEALRSPFVFEFKIDAQIDAQNTYIPSMILQPIIENAILHGLSVQQGERKLWVNIKLEGEAIRCEIIDNGIGIKMAQAQKRQHHNGQKSVGLSLVNQRLALLTGKADHQVRIIDRSTLRPPNQGTQVSLIIPVEQ